MNRYVYVNISYTLAVYMIRYGSICNDSWVLALASGFNARSGLQHVN